MGIIRNPLNASYKRAETNSVQRNLKAKFDEQVVSVFDFMTVSQIASVRANDLAEDVTAPLQNALDWFGSNAHANVATGTGPRWGTLYFPIGTYKVTSTLLYEGVPAWGIRLLGEQSVPAGSYGSSQLIWAGASGGTLIHTYGLLNSDVENITFAGGGLAKYCFHLDSTSFADAGPGCSNVVFRRCTFQYWLENTTSAGLMLGHTTSPEITEQVDNIRFYNCFFAGNAVLGNGSCVRKDKGGNVKDHYFNGCMFTYADYGLNFSDASSTLVAVHCTSGGLRVCDFNFRSGLGGNLRISDHETENFAGTRFIDMHSSGGANPGHATLLNNSWQSSADTDDIVMSLSGSVTLIGNWFYNRRSVGVSIAKVQMTSPLMSANAPGAITSLGNYYENAVDHAPFYDDSGNQLFVDGQYYPDNNFAISAVSLNDLGGIGGSLQKLEQHLPGGTHSAGITIGHVPTGATRTRIKRHMRGTATWDPGSIAAAASATTTVTVTGAVVGDEVTVGFSNSLQGMILSGYVSASGTVTCVLFNATVGALDLASGTVSASVWQH